MSSTHSHGPTEVLIIGGGIFGLGTALALAEKGYVDDPSKILVIDRSDTPPETDAASYDINKITRAGDYRDPLYADLSVEALYKWMNDPLWKDHFFQSGVMATATQDTTWGRETIKAAFDNLERLYKEGRLTLPPVLISNDEQFRHHMGADDPEHPLELRSTPPHAYLNRVSGWSHAAGASNALADRCRAVGVRFAAGLIRNLVTQDDRVNGAETDTGVIYTASRLVVLAAGSWASAILPELHGKVVATGQVLATIQLTDEEAKAYAKVPVCSDRANGFYMFPPNPDNKIKVAIHDRGYLNPQPSLADPELEVSLPRTKLFHGDFSEHIPKRSLELLRSGLNNFWPALARKPFSDTRMCWYCDTEDGHFLISYHDKYKNLFLATGGSGHAFKFAPLLGDLCAKGIEGSLPPDLEQAWSFTRQRGHFKSDRIASEILDLRDHPLASKADLKC